MTEPCLHEKTKPFTREHGARRGEKCAAPGCKAWRTVEEDGIPFEAEWSGSPLPPPARPRKPEPENAADLSGVAELRRIYAGHPELRRIVRDCLAARPISGTLSALAEAFDGIGDEDAALAVDLFDVIDNREKRA